MTFFAYLKNIFILLIFLQVAPPLLQGIKKQYSSFLLPSAQVGMLRLNGTLNDSAWYTKQLRTFFKHDDIKAILIKIESCGSAAGTGQALCNEIKLLKKQYPKPIIAITENICASGAYYIASATDHIIASGQAVIGSIGSYLPCLFQLEGFMQEHHIGYEAIKAGTYKTSTDPFTSLDAQGKAQLQEVVDSSYEQFVADVALNRKLAIQKDTLWADGKLFTGKQALALGLIDELGSISTAITYIKNKKLIEGDIEWVHPEPRGGIMQRMFSQNGAHNTSLFNSISTYLLTGIQQMQLKL